MMKKVLLVVLCLMVAATVSFAQTSGPSNVAGYVKIVCGGDVYLTPYATPFGLPFKFWDVLSGVPQYGVTSTKPSDIVGDQAAAGTSATADKIMNQTSGEQAYRNSGSGNAWTDLLEDNSGMIPGCAFWYINKSGAARNLVLAGEVDNAGNYGTFSFAGPEVGSSVYATPYTWRDSRNVPVDSLTLLAQGFTGGTAATSDKLTDQSTGDQLMYRTDWAIPGWDYGGTGLPTDPFHYIVPGRAYWMINKHVDHDWNYTYVGVPVLPMRSNDYTGVVSGTSRNAHETSKGAVRAATSVKKTTTSKSSTKVKTNK